MSMQTNEIEKLLNLVRQLVSLVKDETLPDAHADREVAKILVGLDQLMSRIDGNSDEAPKGVNQLAARMEIDPPKKTTTRTKKAK